MLKECRSICFALELSAHVKILGDLVTLFGGHRFIRTNRLLRVTQPPNQQGNDRRRGFKNPRTKKWTK